MSARERLFWEIAEPIVMLGIGVLIVALCIPGAAREFRRKLGGRS